MQNQQIKGKVSMKAKRLKFEPDINELGREEHYADPNGAPCIVAIEDSGRWLFLVEPNIHDGLKEGTNSLAEDCSWPDDLDMDKINLTAGVYEAKTVFTHHRGDGWRTEDEWWFDLEIGRLLYEYEPKPGRHD